LPGCPPEPDRILLTVSLTTAEIERAQDVLAGFLESRGVTPPVRYRVRLVIEELLTNLVMHGRFAGPPPPGRVAATLVTDGVRLVIEDAAAPFDPRATPDPAGPPRLEEDAVGGLGLPLVRRMAQILAYDRAEDGWNRTEVMVAGNAGVPS
jgi:anti-sigma regulatory factor (Ser/Thr protein kinase)